jgi:hypothetical protein
VQFGRPESGSVFRTVHNQSPIAFVIDTMTMIRQSLEEEQSPAVVGTLQEFNVGCGSRPKRYLCNLQRTSKFAKQYDKEAMGWGKKRNVLKTLC